MAQYDDKEFRIIRMLGEKCGFCQSHKSVWNDQNYEYHLKNKYNITFHIIEVYHVDYPVPGHEAQQLNRPVVGDPSTKKTYTGMLPSFITTTASYYDYLKKNPKEQINPKMFIRARPGFQFNDIDAFIRWVGECIGIIRAEKAFQLKKSMEYGTTASYGGSSSSSGGSSGGASFGSAPVTAPASVYPAAVTETGGTCGSYRITNLRRNPFKN